METYKLYKYLYININTNTLFYIYYFLKSYFKKYAKNVKIINKNIYNINNNNSFTYFFLFIIFGEKNKIY